jgi:hypothetical protein
MSLENGEWNSGLTSPLLSATPVRVRAAPAAPIAVCISIGVGVGVDPSRQITSSSSLPWTGLVSSLLLLIVIIGDWELPKVNLEFSAGEGKWETIPLCCFFWS